MNLMKHHDDFALNAEWNFFATSHGKNACDGVGGTVKRLAAHASLQRAKEKDILTPRQLYEFASEEIPGITSFYVSSDDIQRNRPFLENLFSLGKTIPGTAHTIVLFQYQIQRCDFQESQVKVSQMLFTEIMLYLTTSTILKKLKLGVT